MSEEPWQQPPIYVRARNQLDSVFLKVGFERDYERFDWSSFGSIYACYRQKHGPIQLRIVWDGRDSYLSVDRSVDGERFEAIAWTELRRDSESSQQETKLQEFNASVARQVAKPR
jgi:hypothetical protein